MEKPVLSGWKELAHKGVAVTRTVVNLRVTLFNGQAFTWHKSEEPEEYWGVCKGNYFEFRYNQKAEIEFRSTDRLYRDEVSPEQSIVDYFNLSLDYNEIFKKLKEENAHFRSAYERAAGLRVLRQDPWECMIGFICSQNNNIKRIGQMVQSLCRGLGEPLLSNHRGEFRAFPTAAQVAASSPERLSGIGFGYRAKYMVSASQELIQKGGVSHLFSLRANPDPKLLNESLQAFTGVGPKVADCISLFALDCYSLVPVDTHMFQLCEKLYKKKFTRYDSAREFLQKQLGEKYAGIAHTFLFTFEISEFKPNPAQEKKDTPRPEQAPDRDSLKSKLGPVHQDGDGLTKMQLRKPNPKK